MSLSTDFPKVVFDQSAETFSELLVGWPKCASSLRDFCRQQIECGVWERVCKKIDGKTVSAYRRTAKKPTRHLDK